MGLDLIFPEFSSVSHYLITSVSFQCIKLILLYNLDWVNITDVKNGPYKVGDIS